MSDGGKLDIERYEVNGEYLCDKLEAIGWAYTVMAETGDPFSSEIIHGMYLLHSQTLEELKLYVFGKKEQSAKDGE